MLNMLRQHRGGFTTLFLIIFISSRVSSQGGPNLQSGVRDNESQSTAPSFFFYQRLEYPRDCHEVLSHCSSSSSDGVYLIKPDGYHEPFEVYCANSLDGGGWMTIQRRHDDSINFNRTWGEYESGFGFLSQEFWLGNEKISYITNQREYQLRVDITTASGLSYFVRYDAFRISDGFSNYKLVSTGQFNGTADTYIQWCPTNTVFNSCKCEGSCADPDCTTSCSNTPGCVCPDGFLVDDDDCIPKENCGCYLQESDEVLVEGEVYVNHVCTKRCSCNSGQISCDETYQCSPNGNCEDREGLLQCYCNIGYTGDGVQCTRATGTDCHDFIGETSISIHLIQPSGWTDDPFQAPCDVSDGGGWLVFQRRVDSSENFYRYWNEYKVGFGSVDGSFWLGNDKLTALTSQGSYELRIELVSKSGQHYYAKYSSFSVGNEGTNYRLSVSGYDSSSTVGYDAMAYHNGRPFTTRDRDNDAASYNCASYGTTSQSAWWFGGCDHCDLNAPYTGSGVSWTIRWSSFPGGNYNIQSTEMKIRPRS